MLTAQDIQNKQFAKGVRGYREDEVDTFLDMLTLDFDKLTKENVRLRNEMAALEAELEKYRSASNEVTKTMQQAQSLMDDIGRSAEKRAEILVRNAELDAETIVREARENAQRLEDENRHIKQRYIAFRDRYKEMLEQELSHFESVQEDMFPDFEVNRLEEILAEELPGNDISTDTDSTEATRVMKQADVLSGISGSEDDRKTMVLNLEDLEI